MIQYFLWELKILSFICLLSKIFQNNIDVKLLILLPVSIVLSSYIIQDKITKMHDKQIAKLNHNINYFTIFWVIISLWVNWIQMWKCHVKTVERLKMLNTYHTIVVTLYSYGKNSDLLSVMLLVGNTLA